MIEMPRTQHVICMKRRRTTQWSRIGSMPAPPTKYDGAHLRVIRALKGVGRPPHA